MKLDNAFEMKEPDADSRILAFRDRTVYLKNEGEITFLKYHVWVEYCKTHHKKVPGLVYLFSVDDISFYLTELYEDVEIPGFMYHKLFAVRSMKPKERVFAATTAWHLYVWYRDNQFCGRCAHPLVHSRTERMLQCPVCNNMVFPKIAPTAASASSPKNDPTIRVSTRLYVSCSRLARKIGSAKASINREGFPFVRSFILLPRKKISLFS